MGSILSGRMFGRKAVETGAFRTACTSRALLCVRRLEALAGSQVYYCTGKALCGAVSLWDSPPTFRFHFPPVPIRDDESHRGSSLPGGGRVGLSLLL